MNPTPLNTPSPFVWGEIALSQVVHLEGVPHVTRRAIGEWLEYADAQKGIDNILTRNPHIEAHGIPLNLRGMDGARDYETEVFHPIGFLLIVMESGQPKAHAMKAAVAEFVWRFAGPQRLSETRRGVLMKLRLQLLDRLGTVKDAFVRTALLGDLREVSLSLGLPVPDVALLGKDARQLALTV